MKTRRMNWRVRLGASLAVALTGAALIVSCGDDAEKAPAATPVADDRPPAEVTMVTTLPVFADFIRISGGDRVEALVVLPEGLASDVSGRLAEIEEMLKQADFVLYNGLDLEGAVEDLLFTHKPRGVQITAYSFDVDSPTQEGMLAADARDNPYLWLDPVLAVTYVDTSWDSLVIVDGAAVETYRANAARYKDELRALHQEVEEKLAVIPAANRKLVAFSEAFFHLARRYDLEPVTLPLPVSTEDPSPRRVEAWADLISEQGVPAVFVERGFESELLRQAARKADVEVCSLYVDAFDDEVTAYVELVTFNADELARCLGG